MIKKLISIIVIILLFGTTFAYAQTPPPTKETKKDDSKPEREDAGAKIFNPSDEEVDLEEEMGEDIIINIDEYQPRIMRTSLLEEQDINVYALLTGLPTNPLITIEKINNINVKPVKITTKPADKKVNIGSIRYIKPQRQNLGVQDFVTARTFRMKNSEYDLSNLGSRSELNYNNLGTIIVPIKRIAKENDVPESVDIELEGKIELFVSEDLGHSSHTFALPQLTESEWLSKREGYKFYAGYIRAAAIYEGGADFDIYDVNGNKLTKAPIKIAEGEKKVFRTRSLYDNIRGFGSLFDKFYINLNDIRSRSKLVDAVIYKGDGEAIITSLSEGSRLYPGSNWIVSDIEFTTRDGKDLRIVTLKDESKLINKWVGRGEVKIEFGEDADSGDTGDNGKSEDTAAIPKESCGPTINRLDETIKKDEKKDDENFAEEISGLGGLYENGCSSEEKNEIIGLLKKIGTYYTEQWENYEAKAGSLEDGDDKATAKNNADKYQALIEALNEKIKSLSGEQSEYSTNIKQDNIDYLLDAISAYQTVVENYPDSDKAKEAQLRIGYIYMKMHDEGKAINAFQEYIDKFGDEDPGKKADLELIITKLKQGLKLKAKSINLQDGDESIVMLITDVSIPDVKSQSYAYISIDNGPEIAVRQGSSINVKNPQMDIKVASVEDNKVKINYPINDENKESAYVDVGDSKTIRYGEKAISLKIKSVNVQREALVTIEPVSERAESFVRFNLHLPIEKRPFELPLFSDTIDEEINKTAKLIKKLDGVITKVNKIHSYWIKGCYATFAAVWAKNLISGGTTALARQKIRDKWENKCNEDKKNPEHGRESFDSCLIRQSDKYNEDLSSAEGIINKIDSKDYLEEQDVVAKISGISDEKKEELKESQTLKDWYFAKEFFKKDPSYVDKFIEEEINVIREIQEQNTMALFDKLDKDYNSHKNMLGELDTGTDYGYLSHEDYISNREELFSIIKDLKTKKAIQEYLGTEKNQEFEIGNWLGSNHYVNQNIDKLGAYEKNAVKQKLANDLIGIKDTYFREFEPSGSVSQLNIVPVEEEGNKICNYINRDTGNLKEIYEEKNVGKKLMCNDVGNVIKRYTTGKANPLYIKKDDTTEEFIPIYIRPSEPKEKHKPMVTRVAEGNRNANLVEEISIDSTRYLEVEYSANGRIIKTDVYERYFPNSDIGTSQGKRLNTIQDEIKKAKDNGDVEYRKALESADNCITKLNSQFSKRTNYRKGDKVKCSTELGTYMVSEKPKETPGPNCVDFMNPGDCKLLFNACDPVICPTSRCNLGGNWEVDNVVETGIIGSSVLCMNNFPEVAMPVCITGIGAGLQNINSILSGYKQCLETQKVNGQSVGVCDRIRNIYICDMLWREGLAIFNVKGGLMSLVTEKAFASSKGSEYSSFRDNFDNAIDSAKYFTQNYGKNVFASYNGGSLDEIGTQICKSAIFGKVPGAGNFFSQIQKPESPPQFIAFFDSIPYQDVSRIPTSIYSVYYHVYAGENEDISYSVYLRSNDETGTLINAPRPQFIVQNKRLGKGKFADENIDREYQTGYNEICVDIESARYGRIQECGFGKVTTDFGMNYLNDMYLAGEAKKQIDSEKECVPEAGRLTDIQYSDSSLKSGSSNLYNTMKSGVGSFSTGLTQTGIIRKCAGVDPDMGTNNNNDFWRPVGTCGKDEKGRDLGVCYLYTEPLKELIKDKERFEETEKSVESLRNVLEKNGYDFGYLSEQRTTDLMSTADSSRLQCNKDDLDKCKQAIQMYQKVVREADDTDIRAGTDIRAEAQFGIGQTYERWYLVLTERIETAETTQQENGETHADNKKAEVTPPSVKEASNNKNDEGSKSETEITMCQSKNKEKWGAISNQFNNRDVPKKAIDNDYNTRWTNGAAMEGGEYLILDFGGQVSFNQIELYSKNYEDCSHQLDLFGKNNDEFTKIDENSYYPIYIDTDKEHTYCKIEIKFKTSVNYKEIKLTNKKISNNWWSINELNVCNVKDSIQTNDKLDAARATTPIKSTVKRVYIGYYKNGVKINSKPAVLPIENGHKLKINDMIQLVVEFNEPCNNGESFKLILKEDDVLQDDVLHGSSFINPDNDCKIVTPYKIKEKDFDMWNTANLYVGVYGIALTEEELDKPLGESDIVWVELVESTTPN